MLQPNDVLDFWFGPGPVPEARLDLWFGKNTEVDEEIRQRFGSTLEAAARGECDGWAETPRGRLALVLLLDQFSRHVYRGTPRMFDQDPRARTVVYEGLARGDEGAYHPLEAGFFFLPLEHSESLEDQRRSVELYAELHGRASEDDRRATAEFLKYAQLHHDIIARFGRFPHRNDVLGRPTTQEEAAFLLTPNSSF